MFANPILLWGLLFALLPLAIHLINLLRHRPVEWGAMEFLLAAYRKHRARVRMKEFLLLLMRMLLIVFVVLMLAGPILRGVLPGGAKTHHIVLLDDSFSMSDRLGEVSVFEGAKTTVQKLIDELIRQGGTHNLTLLRTSQALAVKPQADLHEQRISRSFREIFPLLESLKASHRAGGLPEALDFAEKLAPSADRGTRILYVISDFRTRDWKENPSLTRHLESLAQAGFRVRLIDCAPAGHSNLGLSGLKPQDGIRAAGVPLLMAVQVTNFGLASAQNVVLHPEILSERGFTSNAASNAAPDSASGPASQTLPAVTIPEIPAGKTVTATFAVTFPQAGSQSVRVTLAPDSITEDDQVTAALFVPPFEPVLIIDDSLDGSTSRFLRTALAPGERVRTGVSPRVEKARFLSTNDLSAFRSIYLTDTASLEPQAIMALEEFAQNGGGLCVFLGPHTDPLMAQKWHREGKGFFPVILDQTEELPPYYAAPDLRVSPHPIFRVFSGEHAAQFNTIHVERYFTLDDASLESLIPLQDETTMSQQNRRKEAASSASPQKDSLPQVTSNQAEAAPQTSDEPESQNDVHVIAALRNNSPLVLERAYGKGKVIVFLTTADRQWTDWPVGNPSRPNPFAQGSFVVMVLQLQAYLAREPFASWRVGEPLTVRFPSGKFAPSVSFLNPDSSLWERVSAITNPDGTQSAGSSPTHSPGLYRAELSGLTGTNERRLFAVNPDVREGNVRKISREELASCLREVPFDFTTDEDFRFLASDAARSLVSDWILGLILVWMVLEMLLAASASYHLTRTSNSRGGEK